MKHKMIGCSEECLRFARCDFCIYAHHEFFFDKDGFGGFFSRGVENSVSSDGEILGPQQQLQRDIVSRIKRTTKLEKQLLSGIAINTIYLILLE